MPSFADLLAQAAAFHATGDLASAERLCRQAIALNPADATAHSLLGDLLGDLGKFDESTAAYERAVALRPTDVALRNNLAVALASQNKLDLAANCLRRAVELDPRYAEGWSNLGAILIKQQAFAAAADCFERALSVNSDYAEAHYNLGIALVNQKKFTAAAARFYRAIELRPGYAQAHYNLGLEALRASNFAEAEAWLRRAVTLKPDYPQALANLALALAEQGRSGEAIASYRQALALAPNYAEASNNLGITLVQQNQVDESLNCFRRAIELDARYADPHLNLATALAMQNQFDEAIAHCRRALQLEPELIEGSRTLASLLARQGRVGEAQDTYREAMRHALRPELWNLALASLCPIVFESTGQIDEYRSNLLAELERWSANRPDFHFMDLVTAGCMPSLNLHYQGRDELPIRRAYARLIERYVTRETARAVSSGRPRIGFVTTQGHEYGFLRSLGKILERINPELFELVVLASPRGIGLLRSGIESQTVHIRTLPIRFDHMVSAIRAAAVDLLYYWEVGTDATNYFLPFFRLAPVQCTSWGIQATSGICQLDNYLSNRLVEPDDAQSQYSEKLVLAETLLTWQRRASAENSKQRADFGIRRDAHVYLCAQHLAKIHPDFDPILASILRADREGLVVFAKDAYGGIVAKQLFERFRRTIPDVVGQIIFLPFQARADYLSLTAAADVLLDPIHYGGVNSSYDGFSLAKPIVTWPSRFQRGRYAFGCYQKMEVMDCVAATAEDYVAIAVRLGQDVAFRGEISKKLREASSVLFEDAEAVREHERLFANLLDEARQAN